MQKQNKPKKPAVVVLLLDQIKKGIKPSSEVLDAINDEVDQECMLEIAKALLGPLEVVSVPKQGVGSQPQQPSRPPRLPGAGTPGVVGGMVTKKPTKQ